MGLGSGWAGEFFRRRRRRRRRRRPPPGGKSHFEVKTHFLGEKKPLRGRTLLIPYFSEESETEKSNIFRRNFLKFSDFSDPLTIIYN